MNNHNPGIELWSDLRTHQDFGEWRVCLFDPLEQQLYGGLQVTGLWKAKSIRLVALKDTT